jgi:hypothetical protein
MGKVPFFLLSIQNRNKGGGGRAGATCRRWMAAVPGTTTAGSGGTETGGRGRLVPVLTSGWGGLWREIDDDGRSVIGAAWDGGGGSSGEREGSAWEVQGVAESGAGLFIGAERRWLCRAEHAELTRPSMAVREKYLTVDSVGEVSAGIRGRGVIAALWTRPFQAGCGGGKLAGVRRHEVGGVVRQWWRRGGDNSAGGPQRRAAEMGHVAGPCGAAPSSEEEGPV